MPCDQGHGSVQHPHFVNDSSEQVDYLVRLTQYVSTGAKAIAKFHGHPSASVHGIAPSSLAWESCPIISGPIVSIGNKDA